MMNLTITVCIMMGYLTSVFASGLLEPLIDHHAKLNWQLQRLKVTLQKKAELETVLVQWNETMPAMSKMSQILSSGLKKLEAERKREEEERIAERKDLITKIKSLCEEHEIPLQEGDTALQRTSKAGLQELLAKKELVLEKKKEEEERKRIKEEAEHKLREAERRQREQEESERRNDAMKEDSVWKTIRRRLTQTLFADDYLVGCTIKIDGNTNSIFRYGLDGKQLGENEWHTIMLGRLKKNATIMIKVINQKSDSMFYRIIYDVDYRVDLIEDLAEWTMKVVNESFEDCPQDTKELRLRCNKKDSDILQKFFAMNADGHKVVKGRASAGGHAEN